MASVTFHSPELMPKTPSEINVSLQLPGASADLQAFLAEYQNESDRACAVLGAAYIDVKLDELIRASLTVPDKALAESLSGKNGPLSSFSSRINLSYALGLITKSERDDLNLIREVRNAFAHQLHGLTFASPKVASWSKGLAAPKIFGSKGPHLQPRHSFIVAIGLLSVYLVNRVRTAKRFPAPSLPMASLPKDTLLATLDAT